LFSTSKQPVSNLKTTSFVDQNNLFSKRALLMGFLREFKVISN
jgi:hypothetical protein